MTERNKTRFCHYKFEVILILLSIIFVLIDVYVNRIHYIAGLKGNPFYALNVIFLMLFLFGLLLVLLIIGFINLIKITIKAFKLKKVEWLRVLFSLTPFFCVALFFNIYIKKPGAVYFLQGYEKWVQKEVDIDSIRKWLISLDPIYSEKEYFEAKDFPEDLPKTITKLEPYHMYFGKFDAENRSVIFIWGSALGHWGISIGLPDMETPKEGCVKISESELEYRRPIRPGVYIFDRG